jgi:hypothetical protein
MKAGRKSLSGLIVILFSLTMAIAIGSIFYYHGDPLRLV